MKPLWLKYRNEMLDLREQVEKKELEARLVSLESSRQKKRAELAVLEKALQLARAKYQRERYNGLLAFASGVMEDAESMFGLVISALTVPMIFIRAGAKLKALDDEIKKLGGKANATAKGKNQGKEKNHG